MMTRACRHLCRQSRSQPLSVTVNEPAPSQDAPPSAIEAVTVMAEDPGFVQPKTLESPALCRRRSGASGRRPGEDDVRSGRLRIEARSVEPDRVTRARLAGGRREGFEGGALPVDDGHLRGRVERDEQRSGLRQQGVELARVFRFLRIAGTPWGSRCCYRTRRGWPLRGASTRGAPIAVGRRRLSLADRALVADAADEDLVGGARGQRLQAVVVEDVGVVALREAEARVFLRDAEAVDARAGRLAAGAARCCRRSSRG